MIGYPIDSHVSFEHDGTPVYDRAISAAPFRKLFKSLFSDGVLPNPSTNLQVSAGAGMTVVVQPGFAMCNGCLKLEEQQRTLVVQAASSTYDRIDTVVMRLDDNDAKRICDLYVIQGTPSKTPVRPALRRDGSVWELGLADLYIPKNSPDLSNQRITDTRYETVRCGIISSISEFDTTMLYKQVQDDLKQFKTEEQGSFQSWFDSVKAQLTESPVGNLKNQIDQIKKNMKIVYDASQYGVSTLVSAETNSKALQNLINTVSDTGGGTIYIPSGRYRFGSVGNNAIGAGRYCVQLKSNVNIIGDAGRTIFEVEGTSDTGIDMFVFQSDIKNSYEYLENCLFADFVVDAAKTSISPASGYCSHGKGFMIQPCRNCHWERVVVKNTDATGFGMDFPVMCTYRDCVAESCGKAWSEGKNGGSGFGVGIGLSSEESIVIEGCHARDCGNWGFFFEHQGRFENYVSPLEMKSNKGFFVNNCMAQGNRYDFGGVVAVNVKYTKCMSYKSKANGFRLENSRSCTISDCECETSQTGFAIVGLNETASDTTQGTYENIVQNCKTKACDTGVVVGNYNAEASISNPKFDLIVVKENTFFGSTEAGIYVNGLIGNIAIMNNFDLLKKITYGGTATFTSKTEIGNNWN